MGFSRQEHRSRLPRPPPGDLSDPGIKPASLRSPPLAGRFFTTSTTWEDLLSPLTLYQNQHSIGKSWRSQLAREHTSKIFHVLYFHVTARTTFFKSLIFFNLFFIIYFGCAGSPLLHTGLLQRWRVWLLSGCSAGFSLWWLLLLPGRDSGHVGSVAAAHGLSCPTACGTFPDQGSNPCPLHWQVESLLVDHQGSPGIYFK